ncbi:3-isopropylmalate dehydratase large subunit [Gordonia sp. HNM0687]|uniref:3-isopropylmalate dehydratase large subunit n=1 Tax=Gordonia mangrovi TaxID=2665643 RepID=A0A6L7GXN5_9ACTN|nr:3-isopropylmalate dehydratase large subunit [Gordonia mangrovi]MXP23851.1 3-isopropylmalate dehydratase large subunit [Gordonia mangrovi]
MPNIIEKLWESHVVHRAPDSPDLLYVDFHLLHEGSSPQAFDGLRRSGRRVRRPDLTLATEDHIVPTGTLTYPPRNTTAALLMRTLRANCEEFGITLHPMNSQGQGIVHVIGPELGVTQPGMTVLCGDSHTSTHGAFGALAFGIGTSQVEHVLATQTLAAKKPKTMAVNVLGALPTGATAKDLALYIISQIGSGGAQGHIVEYRGDAIRSLSMEQRMTLCNMSIELGARAGLVGPDETTFDYLRGRSYAPSENQWAAATERWLSFSSDDDSDYDAQIDIDAGEVSPYVTWGTNPSQAAPLSATVPEPDSIANSEERLAADNALKYMDLAPGTPLSAIRVDTVFLGSCTNGRIEDLRAAADILRGRAVASGVRMVVVPGSMAVKADAEAEGLNRVFTDAGAEWRNPGCSLCVGMNDDVLARGQRAASTSNRNFEGRQGKGSRTHLVSPAVAAATAVTGQLTSPDRLAVLA